MRPSAEQKMDKRQKLMFSLKYHLKPHLHLQFGPRFVCVGSVHTSRLQQTKVTTSSCEASNLRVCALLDSTHYFLYGSEALHHIKPTHHRVPCDGGSCVVAVIVAKRLQAFIWDSTRV